MGLSKVLLQDFHRVIPSQLVESQGNGILPFLNRRRYTPRDVTYFN